MKRNFMRTVLFISLFLCGFLVHATETKVDLELDQKKEVALKIIKAVSIQSRSEITVQDAYRLKGKIVIQISESYETNDSGVRCNKTVEFSKNVKDNRLNIIKIFEGLCFS